MVQRMQLDRALLHDSKRQTYDQTKKCAETLLLLGQVSAQKFGFCELKLKLISSHTQTDRAVQLLLETDSSNPEYYTDALK